MKHQYVGDINDYRKYALLRALADGGANRIGVCWMLTPDDGGTHGNKLDYLSNPQGHRKFDPPLFDILAGAKSEPDWRRLSTIEASGVIPGATYFDEPLPQGREERATFMAACHSKFADADLVFFSPDNGIDVPSSQPGRKTALKYVFLDEVAAFYGERKSVLIYQHRPKLQPMNDLIAACTGRLEGALPGSAIWAFRTSQVVFFLAIHPESPARLAFAAMNAAARFHSGQMTGSYLGRAAATPQ